MGVTDKDEALVQQIAEAMAAAKRTHRPVTAAFCNCGEFWTQAHQDDHAARAVLPLVEAQVEAETRQLRKDVAGQTRSAQNGWRTADAMRARVAEVEAQVAPLRDEIEGMGKSLRASWDRERAAESAVRQVRELADEWEAWTPGSTPPTGTAAAYKSGIAACVEGLRDVLARVGAADTQPEGAGVCLHGNVRHVATQPEVICRDCRATNWRGNGWRVRPTAGGKVEGSEIPSPETSGAGSSDTAPEARERALWRLSAESAANRAAADTAPESGEGR